MYYVLYTIYYILISTSTYSTSFYNCYTDLLELHLFTRQHIMNTNIRNSHC